MMSPIAHLRLLVIFGSLLSLSGCNDGSGDPNAQIGANLRLRASLSGRYTSAYNTGSNLDPLKNQKELTLWNGRIGVGSADAGPATTIMASTPRSISTRFMTSECSKIAPATQPALHVAAGDRGQLQPAFTAAWPSRRLQRSPESVWPSASATVSGSASSSSGRPSQSMPSHNSTTPAAAMIAAPMRNDHIT